MRGRGRKRVSDCLIARLGASGGHCKRSHVNHIDFRTLVRYRPGAARPFGFSTSVRATTGRPWMMLSYRGRHVWSAHYAHTTHAYRRHTQRRCRRLSLSRHVSRIPAVGLRCRDLVLPWFSGTRPIGTFARTTTLLTAYQLQLVHHMSRTPSVEYVNYTKQRAHSQSIADW
jgi:hypothetical protein